jgi:cyanophycinase
LLFAAGLGVLIHLSAILVLLSRVPEVSAERLQRPRGEAGILLVAGGGPTPEAVSARFFKLAGGRSARIVVIPTASDWADASGVERAADTWKDRGAASAVVLHTLDRRRADDREFVRPLTTATGVWIGGGHQSRLSTAYAGTAVERELQALLARGGVVGGTSAGAGIMSQVMIVTGRCEARLGRGLDLFPHVVIDQHFLKRNRFRRLLGVLETHSDLIGLGVDESTALEVDLQPQRLRVIGNSYAVVCTPGKPSRELAPVIEILKPGDELDLARFRSGEANAVTTAIEVEGY